MIAELLCRFHVRAQTTKNGVEKRSKGNSASTQGGGQPTQTSSSTLTRNSSLQTLNVMRRCKPDEVRVSSSFDANSCMAYEIDKEWTKEGFSILQRNDTLSAEDKKGAKRFYPKTRS
jgi:hypothetical protein